MNFKSKIKLWTAIGLCAGFALQAGNGFCAATGASFLKVDPSPRTYALGGSNALLSLGAEALSGNPANLGIARKKFELFTSFSNLIDNEQFSHVAIALNRSTVRTHFIEAGGVSMTRLSSGGLEGRDKTGAKTGSSFGSEDRAFSFSAATLIGSDLRLGLTGKTIQSEIAGYSSKLSFAGDLGMNYQFRNFSFPLAMGLALRNFGQPVQYLAQRDPLPTALELPISVGAGHLVGLFGAQHEIST